MIHCIVSEQRQRDTGQDRQVVRVHKVQNRAEDRSLRYAGGNGTNCKAGSVDAHPEGSVAEIRPEEKHYGRWYGGVSKFEEKTFVPDFTEGIAQV